MKVANWEIADDGKKYFEGNTKFYFAMPVKRNRFLLYVADGFNPDRKKGHQKGEYRQLNTEPMTLGWCSKMVTAEEISPRGATVALENEKIVSDK